MTIGGKPPAPPPASQLPRPSPPPSAPGISTAVPTPVPPPPSAIPIAPSPPPTAALPPIARPAPSASMYPISGESRLQQTVRFHRGLAELDLSLEQLICHGIGDDQLAMAGTLFRGEDSTILSFLEAMYREARDGIDLNNPDAAAATMQSIMEGMSGVKASLRTEETGGMDFFAFTPSFRKATNQSPSYGRLVNRLIHLEHYGFAPVANLATLVYLAGFLSSRSIERRGERRGASSIRLELVNNLLREPDDFYRLILDDHILASEASFLIPKHMLRSSPIGNTLRNLTNPLSASRLDENGMISRVIQHMFLVAILCQHVMSAALLANSTLLDNASLYINRFKEYLVTAPLLGRGISVTKSDLAQESMDAAMRAITILSTFLEVYDTPKGFAVPHLDLWQFVEDIEQQIAAARRMIGER